LTHKVCFVEQVHRDGGDVVVSLALECRGDEVLGQRIAAGIHQSA
jgi:hypothetical protein